MYLASIWLLTLQKVAKDDWAFQVPEVTIINCRVLLEEQEWCGTVHFKGSHTVCIFTRSENVIDSLAKLNFLSTIQSTSSYAETTVFKRERNNTNNTKETFPPWAPHKKQAQNPND